MDNAAFILIILVGYYVLFEPSSPPERPDIKRGKPICLIEPWSVKKVWVVSEGKGEVIFEREGEGWTLTKGKKADNLGSTLEDFVDSLLMTVEIDKFPIKDKVVNECGLDNPTYTVILTDVTDKTYHLIVGDSTPVGTCLYAQFAESPDVLIVGALLNYELGKLDSLME